ncbi:chaoptin-like [Diachasma alloeum]|uniref:chaoptin-like n=1 Tax=Diachasma alloeum TaxID=454923 RepID=UPI0010FADBA7|nr:chaoptin-like [Diachasma alloeum]
MRLRKVLLTLTALLPIVISEFVRSTSDYVPVCPHYYSYIDLSLRDLYLRENNFESVWVPSWSDTPEITHLYMNNNKLTSTSFLSIFPKKLTHLYLNNNRLRTFATGSLKRLKVLHVDHNQLRYVCGTAYCPRGIWLRDAINLQELSLSSADLSVFEKGAMENLTDLKYLDMSNNKLWRIPDRAFRNLTSLVVLKLDDNALIDIPDLLNSKQLEELNLSRNALRDVSPQTFRNLTKLKHIDLSRNKISEITPGVFQTLSSLRTLNLSWNKLKQLPQSWFILQSDGVLVRSPMKLEYLDLSNNQLSEISPRAFKNLTSLVVLKLDSNVLPNIPNLGNLKNLEEFNFSSNALRNVSYKTFYNMTNLKHIDLSRNEIAKITHGVFDMLASLIKLDLSSNKITKLRRNWITSRSDPAPVGYPINLEYLDISNNDLQKIPQKAFQNLTRLLVLKLNNNITEIGLDVIDALPSLTTLDLSWNKFNICTNADNFEVGEHLKSLNLAGNTLPLEFLTSFGHATVETLMLDEVITRNQLSKNTSKDGGSVNISQGSHSTYELKVSLVIPQLKHLYLRKNNLQSLRISRWSHSLPEITHLYLSSNKLTSASFLAVFPEKLTHLYLDDNQLQTFRTGSLENLTVLHLDHNPLDQVCGKTVCRQGMRLTDAINLHELSLSSANLSILEKDAMENLTSLKYLDISNNKLSKLPKGVFKNLTSLVILKLDGNALTDIPDLCNSAKLEEFNLSRNAINKIISETFFNMTNLKHIDLSHNQIAAVASRAFDLLPSLTTLNMSWNQLKKLPEYWFAPKVYGVSSEHPTNFEYLNMSKTAVMYNSRVPDVLEVLKLENNALVQIPDLCNFEKLGELDLSYNAVKNMKQQSFCNLTYLKHINLSHNEMVEMNHAAFTMLPSLTTLDVSWNKLRTFQYWRFSPKNCQAPVLSISVTGNPFNNIELMR